MLISYIIRRILWTIPVLMVTILLSFALVQALPGDPFSANPQVRSNEVLHKQLLDRYGYNEPFVIQYFTYLGNLVQGDFGPSSANPSRTVTEVMLEKLPRSMIVGGLAFVFAALMGTFLGTISALRHNGFSDYLITVVSTLGFAIPSFVLAMYWVGFVAGKWLQGWIPISGWGTWWHWIGPTVILGYSIMPFFVRLVRGTMLETLQSDFVLTARSKGLPWRRTVIRHVLRNSLIPVITNAGPLLGFIITGSFVIEFIFAINGFGILFIDSINQQDYNMALGTSVVLAVIVIFVNLFVDILYTFLDPRIRV